MEFRNKKLEKFEEMLPNQKIAVIGLGVSNIPLIDYLYNKHADVSVFDDREEEKINKEIRDKIKLYGFKQYLGAGNLENLQGFDLIFRSPSCLPTKPELVKEANRGAIITTEIEQLMKLAPCKIIGITGSDGKTTTTTLISEILKEAGYNVFVVKNACASRSKKDYRTALELMRDYGAKLTCVETVLFELLESSKNPHFREVQLLIK